MVGDPLGNPAAPAASPADALVETAAPPETPSRLLGTQIGRYQLLQVLGEGGFGTVYQAEQREPVRREVALKLIKLGMDTRAVIARFEAERQALAVMDHPNIARVFDAGATESGRPYFVMELVRGVPITEYCDTHGLSTRQRLELFVQVCAAIQHAHTKGVIHRDLKPGNVLVSMHEGRPIPKVIDFGVAKATIGRLTDSTLYTEFRQFIGTPEYMSPEQAEMSGLDVDTRADVYSLGVLLYELLTGTTPFESARLRAAGYAAVQRIIREEEPPRPSVRLSTLGTRGTGDRNSRNPTLQDVARRRRTEPQRLARELRGDLDWIVLKSLEKDRTHRYDTASALAADVMRHLNHEPVLARPAGAAYRVRKFVRRHKLGVTAGLAIAAALLLGLGLATYGMFEARTGRNRALAAAEELKRERAAAIKAKEEAEQQRQAAQYQGEIASTVLNFFTNAIGEANPKHESHGPDVTLRHMMDDVAKELESGQLRDVPLVEAQMHFVLGRVYNGMGVLDVAELHFQQASERIAVLLRHDDPAVANFWFEFGLLRQDQGRWQDSLVAFNKALDIYSSRPEDWSAELMDLYRGIAQSHGQLGNMVEAGEFRQKAAEAAQAHASDPVVRIKDLYSQAMALYHERNYTEMERTLRQLIGLAERELGSEWTETHKAGTLSFLGMSLRFQERHAEAETLLRQALSIYEAVLGPRHADLHHSLHNLRLSLAAQSKHGEADAVGLRILDIELASVEQSLAVKPEEPLLQLRRADLLLRLGRIEESAAAYTRAIELGTTEHLAWYRGGHLYLYLGNLADYRRIAADMHRRFSASERPEILERTGKLMLLEPSPPAAEEAANLIDRALAGGEHAYRDWFVIAKALAQVRLGRSGDALSLLVEPAANLPGNGQLCAELIDVIARAYIGDDGTARQKLRVLEERIAAELPVAGKAEITDWENWFAVHILLREAQRLSSGSTTAPATKPTG